MTPKFLRNLRPATSLAFALSALAGCAATESENPNHGQTSIAATPAISMDIMRNITKTLSSDAFGGRAPGSDGEAKTLELLTAEFARAGLEPGNNGSWFQDVPLVGITAERVSPLTIRSAGGDKDYRYGSQMVVGTYRESEQIKVTDSEVVFVGYGINAPERNWNDYAGVDVTGKTVLILVNDPDFGTQSLEGPFGGRAMTYYGRWTYKYEEAARQGAAAALIIHDTAPAAYGWNVVESSWTGPQFYAKTSNAGADQTAANGWIQKQVAEEIVSAGGSDLDTLMSAARVPGFTAVPLAARASVSFSNTIEALESKNVLGVLKGSKRPDEYVVYTAHWDHLGRCKPAPDGDDICNGAVDNATGTAALVALADAHAQAGATDRSLLFLAVTAEESGLLGSKFYADNPVYPLNKTVGGVNMDAFLMAGPANDVIVVGKGKSELDDYLESALASLGRVSKAEPTPEKGFYYRSDHFSFAKRGVPMIYFEGGEDLVDGGVEAGAAIARDYTQNRYHGPKDEYDPNWNWGGAEADLKLYYAVARALANTDQWPNWNPGDEFRAIRDANRK